MKSEGQKIPCQSTDITWYTHIIVLYACNSFVIHKPLSGFVIRKCIQYNYLVQVKDWCTAKHKMVITVYYNIKRKYYLILLSKANTFLQSSCHISPNCITTVFLILKRIPQGDTFFWFTKGPLKMSMLINLTRYDIITTAWSVQ